MQARTGPSESRNEIKTSCSSFSQPFSRPGPVLPCCSRKPVRTHNPWPSQSPFSLVPWKATRWPHAADILVKRSGNDWPTRSDVTTSEEEMSKVYIDILEAALPQPFSKSTTGMIVYFVVWIFCPSISHPLSCDVMSKMNFISLPGQGRGRQLDLLLVASIADGMQGAVYV